MSAKIKLPQTSAYVLSVNDSPTFDRARYEWLRDRGAVVVRANSTQAALAQLDLVSRFDLVITNLRRRENGYQNQTAGVELAATLRRLGHKMPIILYSMNIDTETRLTATHAGINHITVLPSELRQLMMKYV